MVVGAVAAVVLAIVGGTVPCDVMPLQPSCHVALHPGPVEDTVSLVEVAGPPAYVPSGELLLTTVAVEEELDLLEWFRGGLDPSVTQVPRQQVYPEEQDAAEVERHHAEVMGQSQFDAIVAALDHLGYDFDLDPDGVRVDAVGDTGAAARAGLLAGDIVIAVDGEPVNTVVDLRARLAQHRRGEAVTLEVRRGDDLQLFDVEVASESGIGALDADVTTYTELPVDISIDAGAIGGPSAGLMFAVSIVELLGAEDLGAGRVVAGTGSIDGDGTIGAIGGVRQKVLGSQDRDGGRPASVFLVPRDNLDEAGTAPVGRNVLLVPVDTLEDAVTALTQLRAGRQPVGALALGP